MGFEIAGDPAVAVEEHHRRRFFIRDAIDARGKPAGRAFHFRIACAPDWRRRNGGTRRGKRAELIARALRRHRLGIAQRQQRNDLGDDGIERCSHAEPGAKGVPAYGPPAAPATRSFGNVHLHGRGRE